NSSKGPRNTRSVVAMEYMVITRMHILIGCMHFLLKKSVPIIICFGLLTCSLGYAPIDKALLERMTLPQLEKLLNEARRLNKPDIIKQVEPRITFLRARASRPSENMDGEGEWIW